MTLEKESEIDNLKQSLVFVKGVETQALFNFLINCKSAIAATGALAGVPPTLLAPTAFHGATLKALKVLHNLYKKIQLIINFFIIQLHILLYYFL